MARPRPASPPPPAPLKAYHVWFYGELIGELFVGRSASQAKASFCRSVWADGKQALALWPGLRARRCADDEQAGPAIERYEDRNKYWRDKRATRRLQQQADAFNLAYPIGTPVRLATGELTRTRSHAWLPCEGLILVQVEGRVGGLDLTTLTLMGGVVPFSQPAPVVLSAPAI